MHNLSDFRILMPESNQIAEAALLRPRTEQMPIDKSQMRILQARTGKLGRKIQHIFPTYSTYLPMRFACRMQLQCPNRRAHSAWAGGDKSVPFAIHLLVSLRPQQKRITTIPYDMGWELRRFHRRLSSYDRLYRKVLCLAKRCGVGTSVPECIERSQYQTQ